MYYVTFIGNIPLIPEGSKYVSGSSDELGLINPASTEKPIIMYCFQPHIWNIMCTILLYEFEVHERINHGHVLHFLPSKFGLNVEVPLDELCRKVQ